MRVEVEIRFVNTGLWFQFQWAAFSQLIEPRPTHTMWENIVNLNCVKVHEVFMYASEIACVYVCVYVSFSACMRARARALVCMRVCVWMRVCVSVCTSVRARVCVFVHAAWEPVLLCLRCVPSGSVNRIVKISTIVSIKQKTKTKNKKWKTKLKVLLKYKHAETQTHSHGHKGQCVHNKV